MKKQESLFSKVCKNTTPFCNDLDEEDSYIIETGKKSNDK